MKDPQFTKSVIFLNALVPLAILCWDAYSHQLGANPTETAIHITGMMALIFLLLSLTVTPLRKVTGYNQLSHYRRMLGLFAFFYACIHLFTYLDFDRAFSLAGTIDDVLSKKFIFFGMLALLLMLPLAATSTNGMIKRLGAAKWKRLHQLAYVAAILGAVHFWMSKKADKSLPWAFAIALAMLLAYRALALVRNKKPHRIPATR
jgi:sulfoxide reductase heme-binding subunit YedZ